MLNIRSSAIYEIICMPNGKSVITGDNEGQVIIWDVLSGLPNRLLAKKNSVEISSLALSPNGKMLLFGSIPDWVVSLLDLSTNEEINLWNNEDFMICKGIFSSDNKYAVIAGLTGKIIVWDITQSTIHQEFAGPPKSEWLDHVAISPDSSQIAGGYGMSGEICIWNIRTGALDRILVNSVMPQLVGLTYSADGRYLVSGGGKISFWDPQNGETLRVIHATRDHLSDPCVSPNSTMIAANDKEYRVYVFDIESGEEIQHFVGHTYIVTAQCFTPDNRQLLTCSIDGTARLWDIETGRELMRMSTHSGG